MMTGSSPHFVLSAGHGSDSGYSRGRNDYQSNNDDSGGYNRSRNDYQNNDDKGSGGYSRGRNNNDDRGSGGYNRSRNDYQSNNDDGGGYNRGRSDYNSGSGSNDSGLETQRDTIFIQNLPRNVTSEQLRDVFSQIGVIKVGYYLIDT